MLVFNAITTMHTKHDEDENICQEYNSAFPSPTNYVTTLILQLDQRMPQGAWKRSDHLCFVRACFVLGFESTLIVSSLYHVEVSMRLDTWHGFYFFMEVSSVRFKGFALILAHLKSESLNAALKKKESNLP